MSEFTDATVGRYVGQDPERRKESTLDPAAHMRIELLRQTLDAVERAMVYEGVPEEARRRVINRVVWGEPEGLVDVYAQMAGVREQMLAADLSPEFAQAWRDFPSAGTMRPDGEATT